MPSTCNFRHPLERDGTSRSQRLVAALRPEYVSVDERSISDLLIYARKYARLLRYFTLENQPSGDWLPFLENDVSTLVALIASTDHDSVLETFGTSLRLIEEAPSDSEAAAALAGLIPLVAGRAEEIDLWYRRSVKGLALGRALERLIGSVLNDALRDLMSYAARAEDVGISVEPIRTSKFDAIWKLSGVQADPSLFSSGTVTRSEIELASLRVKASFDVFYDALAFLVASAPDFLQETLDSYPEHQPHMALFLSFLQLFGIAQNDLNELTERHLVFYYSEVLQLGYRPATPDSVHIVFELAKNFFEHQVPAGTALKAGKDALGNPLLYTTDDEIVVNRASLGSLRTIFVDKTEDSVRNVYAAPVANSADGLGAEIETEDSKWETFGSPEMPYARVGFAVASPHFLLGQGTREIRITFGFDTLPATITDRSAEVETELRHNVAVFASGEKAWLPIDVTGVVIDEAESSITYVLEIGPEGEPIVAYVDDVLAEGLATSHPVVKFVLDNEGHTAAGGFDPGIADDVEDFDPAESYVAGGYVRFDGEIYEAQTGGAEDTLPGVDPSVWSLVARSYSYDYFRQLSLRRIDIAVDVRGMQQLLLENDNGVINPAKPFLPFGATPRVGSAFYLGSTEIFAKTVDEVTVHVAWGDLPEAGFKEHYTGYTAVGGNDIFITYDLHAPDQEYAEMAETIEDLGEMAFRIQLSMWYVRTTSTAEQVLDALIDATDADDTLFVVDATNGVALSRGVSAEAPAGSGNDLVIVYDLHASDRDYDAVADAIRGLGTGAARLQPSVWRVRTPEAADDALDIVVAAMDVEEDSLIVIDVTNAEVVFSGLDTLEPGVSVLLQAGLDATEGGGIVWGSEYFKGTFNVLHGGSWTAVSPARRSLFETVSPTSDVPKAERSFDLTFTPALSRPDELPAFGRFHRLLQYGFLRLDLKSTFFHAAYPKLLAQAATEGDASKIPNAPYTPLITSVSVDYKAAQTIDYSEMDRHDFEDRVEQFFHLHPFGMAETFPIDDEDGEEVLVHRTPVPVFTVTVEEDVGVVETVLAEGTLLVGIAELDPPQNLSILFQVAEGSADPDAETQEVVWSYLAANDWVDFEAAEILSDGTNGLLTSGIVRFSMPKDMTSENTILPPGMHWIKASVAEGTSAVSKLIDVRPQAVKATFVDRNNDPGHLAEALPADTIAKLETRRAAVKSVAQPYASFGGRMREEGEAYYVRVSERLRHKQRAVSIFDYERIVLEEFPDVYKVKCITHTDKTVEHAPGSVRVIVVPNLRNKNAVDPLQPRVSKNTLEEIQDLLNRRATDFADVYVTNPQYEHVRVEFKVVFRPGKDVGFHLGLLEEDVVKHLSPWLYEEGADLAFGGRIHRSWILNYVEERDYVDYVTDFKMHHIVGTTTHSDVEEAVATTASSVLVSTEEHDVSHLEPTACLTTSS